MEYVSINNVFNYVPRSLRQDQADDDTLKSWAYQAYRKLNFPQLHYEKDIVFMDVVDHKSDLPSDAKKIYSIHFLHGEPSATQLDELFNTTDTHTAAYGSFANGVPLTHKLFWNSEYFHSNWLPVEYAGPYDPEFFCKVENVAPVEQYTVTKDRSTATFTFCDGTIAIVYYKMLTDDDTGDILIAEDPIQIWEYMAASVKRKYWEERMFFGDKEAIRNRAEALMEETARLNECKGILRQQGINLANHQNMHNVMTRVVAFPSWLYEQYRRKYAR